MVLEGQVDAAAIDSHLLDVLRSRDVKLATRLRVVDMLGPSSIPPVVVSKRVAKEIKCRIQQALITMHLDDCGARGLREGLIERFVVVVDEDYGDLRGMLRRVEKVAFPFE
jgi:phosphonate transport system substrate-binding protein